MTTSHVEWRYDSPAVPIFDHRGAQAYVSEMKYLWRQEQWRLRQIYIRRDDNERFLTAFAVLSQLAYIVDAKLHHIFTLLSKDLFDELIKIIGLTEMQRERLHVGSSSTPAYIMTLDDIKLLTPILRGAEKMVTSTTCWPISDDIAYHRRSMNQAYKEMNASLDLWKGVPRTSSFTQRRSPSSSRRSSIHSNDESLPGPSRVPTHRALRRNSAGLRLHLRSSSFPSAPSPCAHENDVPFTKTPSPQSPSRNTYHSHHFRPIPPRKRSFDMRTPDSPTFHIRHLPKRIRQGTPTPRKPSLCSSDDTLVSDEPIRDNGKGKEVERWLHHVEASRSLPARAGASFVHDLPPPMPVYFDMYVDDDCISAATAGGSPSATYSDDEDVEGTWSVADWGTPPPPGGGEDGDDDADSAASGSWGGSDSSWATTVRGGDSPGEWAIVAHPEWVQAARRVAYSATTRRDVCDMGRVELPLWRRMLRTVLPFV